MSSAPRISNAFSLGETPKPPPRALFTAALALALAGCPEEQGSTGAPSAGPAATHAAVSATPPPPAPTAPPAVSSAPSGPVHDCPAGSTGDGRAVVDGAA